MVKKTIKVKMFREPGADPVTRDVETGTTIEELLGEYRSHLPFRVITARVDGDDVPLTFKIKKECEITFCDIRDNTANRSFQRGLIMLFLKAVHDLYKNEAKVFIRNSVNRGLFSTLEIKTGEAGGTAGAGDVYGSIDEAGKSKGKGKAQKERRQSDCECNKDCKTKKCSHRPEGTRMPGEAELRLIEKRMWQLVDANIPFESLGGDLYRLEKYEGLFFGLMPPRTGYIYSFALEAMRGGVLLRFPHPADPGKLSIYRRDARIFDAYTDEQEFLDELCLGMIGELNEQVESGHARDIIRIAEQRHVTRLHDIAQEIIDSGKRVVLIAGPSSSGKTTFSKRLIETIEEFGAPKPFYLGTDDYFVDRKFAPKDKKGEYNFEGLDAMDVDLFVKNITELLAGKTANLPRYDFIKGEKEFGDKKLKLKKDQVVVVEGIHALNKKMSVGIDDEVKFRIYISPLTQLNLDDHNRVPSTDVRLIRRMIRDNRTRGNSVVDTIRQWPKVRAGESVNIFPYNNEADEIFNSTLIYELPVLKKYAVPLLEEIKPGEAAFGHAKWLLYFLDFFTPIDDESSIPEASILREFIGGGKKFD